MLAVPARLPSCPARYQVFRHAQTIEFDFFEIWEGRCTPDDEPFTGAQKEFLPMWPTMRTDLERPTVLVTTLYFNKAFTGGGCGDVRVLNTAATPCDEFEVEINIRPGWGWLLIQGDKIGLSSLTIIEEDREAGVSPALLAGLR